jgi:hypothetical protein
MEVANKVQYLNKFWREVCSDARLWKLLNSTKKLNISEKYQKYQCVVERRSKGKLFKGECRISKEKVIFC